MENRTLLAGDAFHNRIDPEDVNDDGDVSPVDILSIVNAMNRGSVSVGHFPDVNNDGAESPVDALLVVNRLNRNRNADADSRRNNAGGLPTPVVEFRSIDGSGNNLVESMLGAVGQNLIRIAEADYADGISQPAGAQRPSARQISNEVSDVAGTELRNERGLTALIYVWGQFLDHDIDLSGLPGDEVDQELFNIAIPVDDALFNPEGRDDVVIDFTRSEYDSTSGTSIDNPREQFNLITSFIDGSQIYGSDQATADSLREFSGGRMLVTDDGLLLLDEMGNVKAGDIRAAENISLTAMHTLFVREHNRLASEIAVANPALSDEAIYQQARSVVIAELQAITYNEFLPALLGKGALSQYRGYDESVDPSIANEFSTAAFRFGHSTINEEIEFFGNDGRPVREPIELRDAFFNAELLNETGIDGLLKYDASTLAQEVDLQVVDSLRNFLFGQPGAGGLDLVALNIQRGRDHGLADYNATRQAYGLESFDSFDDLTSDVELQQALAELYGDVDNIDLWVGLLAEDHAHGASVGELTREIISNQFERLRDGDRFFYKNVYSARDIRLIEQSSLADIIARNSDVAGLQENAFFFLVEIRGSVTDSNSQTSNRRRTPGAGVEGVVVELLNDDGELIATTTTDRQGKYRFHDLPETGDYRVRLATTGEIQDVLIRTGGQRVRGVDFVVVTDN